MKKILMTLCILTLCSSSFAGGITEKLKAVVGRQSVEEAAGYDYITFFWRTEGETLGDDDYSDGDTTATIQGTIAINSTQVKVGTNSIDLFTMWGRYEFDISSSDILSGSECRIGFWLYMDGDDDSVRFIHAEDGTDSSDYFDIERASSSGEVRLDWKIDGGTVVIATTDANMSEDTWYWIEVYWNSATPTRQVHIFDDSSNEQGSGATNSSSFTTIAFATGTLQIGNAIGVTPNYNLDNIIFSNDSSQSLYAIRNETVSPR